MQRMTSSMTDISGCWATWTSWAGSAWISAYRHLIGIPLWSAIDPLLCWLHEAKVSTRHRTVCQWLGCLRNVNFDWSAEKVLLASWEFLAQSTNFPYSTERFCVWPFKFISLLFFQTSSSRHPCFVQICLLVLGSGRIIPVVCTLNLILHNFHLQSSVTLWWTWLHCVV